MPKSMDKDNTKNVIKKVRTRKIDKNRLNLQLKTKLEKLRSQVSEIEAKLKLNETELPANVETTT
jgi:hypothetical protein